jgi:5'(3')-deoxyribonucleotidase
MNYPTVVFDFDGVIHSYSSGWKGTSVIPDPPVNGIKEVIENLLERGYRVVVVSSRCREADGISAIREWLKQYNFPYVEVMAEKPPAIVYVDDRAICFDGNTEPLYEKIVHFKTWYEKGV